MKTCDNCGSKVFRLGCVNCDEETYIEVEFAEELAQIRAEEDEHREAERRMVDARDGAQP